MKITSTAAGLAIVASLVAALSSGSSFAQQPSRDIPARTLPIPDTVSPALQKLMAAPLFPGWPTVPETNEEWKTIAAAAATAARASVPDLQKTFGTSVEPQTMAGVPSSW